MNARSRRVLVRLAGSWALLLALTRCAAGPSSKASAASNPAATDAPRFIVKHDSQVLVRQPPPHGGVGESTAYRYFDELRDPDLIFRKRALHPGAAIGNHALTHDEVYYVASGQGELEVDGSRHAVSAGTAVYMHRGARVGIRQTGGSDLVLIIAYPPAAAR